MRSLELNSEKEIIVVVREQVTIKTSVITINGVTDTGDAVIASISFGNEGKNIVLWEGDAYTQIGAWTDADVDSKILSLLDKGKI